MPVTRRSAKAQEAETTPATTTPHTTRASSLGKSLTGDKSSAKGSSRSGRDPGPVDPPSIDSSEGESDEQAVRKRRNPRTISSANKKSTELPEEENVRMASAKQTISARGTSRFQEKPMPAIDSSDGETIQQSARNKRKPRMPSPTNHESTETRENNDNRKASTEETIATTGSSRKGRLPIGSSKSKIGETDVRDKRKRETSPPENVHSVEEREENNIRGSERQSAKKVRGSGAKDTTQNERREDSVEPEVRAIKESPSAALTSMAFETLMTFLKAQRVDIPDENVTSFKSIAMWRRKNPAPVVWKNGTTYKDIHLLIPDSAKYGRCTFFAVDLENKKQCEKYEAEILARAMASHDMDESVTLVVYYHEDTPYKASTGFQYAGFSTSHPGLEADVANRILMDLYHGGGINRWMATESRVLST
jgi:hypothetical protein